MKVNISLVIAAFAGALLMVSGFCIAHAGPKYRFKTSPAALYQSDNELYFDNKLPKNVIFVEGECPDKPTDGGFNVACTSHAVGTRWYKVWVSPTYNETLTDEREAVLHESCHIRVYENYENKNETYGGDEHGPEWQDCMLTLAKKGAFETIW